jgi:hypothetical protein
MRDYTHPAGWISSGPEVPSPSWAFAIKGLDEACFFALLAEKLDQHRSDLEKTDSFSRISNINWAA